MSESSSETRLSLLNGLMTDPTPERWSRFVYRYGPLIQTWCKRWGLQPADAEDVTQNLLLGMKDKLRRFEHREQGSFRSWLKTLTHHAWYDLTHGHDWRERASGKQEVRAFLESQAAPDQLEAWLHEQDEQDQRERLEHALQEVRKQLGEATVQAFVLTVQEGKSGKEAAKILGITPSHVFVCKSRVIKKLREIAHRQGESS